MRTRIGMALLATPLLDTLAACGAATGPQRELASARALWARRGLASYSIRVARSCECLPEMTGPVVVAVWDGTVESRHYATTGAPVTPVYADLFPSVEGLFGRIEAARRQRVARLEVSYDPAFGYAVRIAIDQDAVMVDDEVRYDAKDLRFVCTRGGLSE